MSTQSVIVRLPSKLVEVIDLLIEKGIFASRAGFINCAISYRLPILLEKMYETTWNLIVVDISIRPQNLKERINQMFDDDRLRYFHFSGEPVRINIRVSDGIINLWKDLMNISDGLFSFQEFVRYSAASYLILWSGAFAGIDAVKQNMTTQLSREAEQSIKDTIAGEYYVMHANPKDYNKDIKEKDSK